MDATVINLRGGWDELMAEHAAICRHNHPVRDVSAESVARFRQLMSGVVYRDWQLAIHHQNGFVFLQVCTVVPDALTGEPIENNGRPLPLCPEMSDGFTIDLAFELVKEFELHEAAENFRVEGVRPYYPHDSSGQPLRQVRSIRSLPSLEDALTVRKLDLAATLSKRNTQNITAK